MLANGVWEGGFGWEDTFDVKRVEIWIEFEWNNGKDASQYNDPWHEDEVESYQRSAYRARK